MTFRSSIRCLALALASLSLAGCGAVETMGGSHLGADPAMTGSIDGAAATAPVTDALLGTEPGDPVTLGKKHFMDGHYGLAEQYYRRAVEQGPHDAEAWVGLAASYDRLRRFELADRAYDQALRISGPSVMILNNQGYSYMLRGEFKRARSKLAAAKARDPDNSYVRNNIELLDASLALDKAVR